MHSALKEIHPSITFTLLMHFLLQPSRWIHVIKIFYLLRGLFMLHVWRGQWAAAAACASAWHRKRLSGHGKSSGHHVRKTRPSEVCNTANQTQGRRSLQESAASLAVAQICFCRTRRWIHVLNFINFYDDYHYCYYCYILSFLNHRNLMVMIWKKTFQCIKN